MAKQRRSLIPSLLVLLIIGSGAYFLWLRSSNNSTQQNTGPDSSVTNTVSESSQDEPSNITTGTAEGIQVFFSNAYANNPSIGEIDPNNIQHQLARFIASAKTSVDCALFELESDLIAQALIETHQRGVTVRIVIETDYADNPEMQEVIDAGIPTVQDERSALMHNKFVIVDGQSLWTGSFNATDNGTFRNNNNAVLIQSADLARNYQTEFEEMFLRNEFGPRSESNTPHTLVKLSGAEIYNYFSPEDDPKSKILRFLKLAKKRIRFMAFSMTDDEIGDLLIKKYSEGVDVEGVLESRGSGLKYSELGRLRKAGVPVLTDGNKYILHHKVIVIDGTWTIMGSYNFSASAANSNDENILIIKSSRIAEEFEKEYERIKRMALEVL